MRHTPRIGLQIGPGDPFWVQVREVIWQQAQRLPVEIVEVDIPDLGPFPLDVQAEVIEDLRVQELDSMIGNSLPPYLVTAIPDHGIPIIYLPETALRHPRLVSRLGLYDAAHLLGTVLTQQRAGGPLLLVSGRAFPDD